MKLIIAGIAVAVLAAACGGDDSSTTAAPTSTVDVDTPTSEPAATQTVAADPTPTQQPPPATPTTQPFEGGTGSVVSPPSSNQAATVVDVRAATHDGFDRIVFEFAGNTVPGYKVQYVDAAAACGSGQPVSLPGSAMITVELSPSTAHTDGGESTVNVSEINLGGAAITKAESTCDFEGVVAWAVGVAGERPFHVFELTEPTRLVIDIANGG